MTPHEVLLLVTYCSKLDTWVHIRDEQDLVLTAKAWHDVLPIALTVDQARAIAADLHARGQRLDPGAIARRASELATPLEQPGTSTLPRPLPAPARQRSEPKAIKAPDAVRPADVPGYRRSERKPSHPVLTQPCPYCRARVGEPCTATGTSGTRPMKLAHPSRYDAAGLPDPALTRLAGLLESERAS